MTPQEEVDERFGAIVFRTAKRVVRAKETPNGQIRVVAHKVKDGHEYLPLAYMLGMNALETEESETERKIPERKPT